MPTYAYRCTSCGHASDEWLKMSEATAERICPNCGKSTYAKQVTAAAFQLKGGGWYVTDFREGNKPAAKKGEGGKEEGGKDEGGKDGGKDSGKDEGRKSAEGADAAPGKESTPAATPAAAPASDKSSPAPAPSAAPKTT
jgi:putative FmdB family regulatory protein